MAEQIITVDIFTSDGGQVPTIEKGTYDEAISLAHNVTKNGYVYSYTAGANNEIEKTEFFPKHSIVSVVITTTPK